MLFYNIILNFLNVYLKLSIRSQSLQAALQRHRSLRPLKNQNHHVSDKMAPIRMRYKFPVSQNANIACLNP